MNTYKIEIETVEKPVETITPHKGGRTERVNLRLTPDELEQLDTERGALSRSDYVMYLVARDMQYVLPTQQEWDSAFLDFDGDGQDLIADVKHAINRSKVSISDVLAALENTRWKDSVFYLKLKDKSK
jgi:hypothetical protein